MGHSHGPEAILAGIRPLQYIMNHNGYEYSDRIIYFIRCYAIVKVTSHSTVPYSLSLAMHISGKLLRSVDTIIYGVALHWHSCNHGLPLKLFRVHVGIFICEGYLMIYDDLSGGCITEYIAPLVELRGDFYPLLPNIIPGPSNSSAGIGRVYIRWSGREDNTENPSPGREVCRRGDRFCPPSSTWWLTQWSATGNIWW